MSVVPETVIVQSPRSRVAVFTVEGGRNVSECRAVGRTKLNQVAYFLRGDARFERRAAAIVGDSRRNGPGASRLSKRVSSALISVWESDTAPVTAGKVAFIVS